MKKFLVIDYEFTMYRRPVGRPRGFFPEIIEIGAVVLDENGKRISELQNFVKPHFYPKHAKEAMEFCMIKPEDMKIGIEFSEMIDKLKAEYVPGETYFVTWGDDDFKVLETGCERHCIDNPIAKKDCLDLAKAYKKMNNLKNTHSLKKAIENLGMEFDGLWHTAFDDAANTGRILEKMLELGWSAEEFMQTHAKSEIIAA